jgi:hypothetical protein
MKTIRMLIGCLALALLLSGAAVAQEKPKATGDDKPAVPVKVQVTLSEYDGEKKVSSMPYALPTLATVDRSHNYSSLRMGLKVPIQTTTKEGQSQMQYMDVGTNIDARVDPLADGRFQVSIQVRRSSVHTLEGAAVQTGEFSGRPVLREFSSGFEFFLRDGQTLQTTTATDPVSGHVLKVDVTLTVVK